MTNFKKNIKTWTVAMFAMILVISPAVAQDKLEPSIGTDIVSKYVWRGVDQGVGTNLQPSLGFGYKGFSLGAWGSVSLAPIDFYELDFSLGYSAGGFSIAVTDYFWAGSGYSYFDYYADNHLFEGTLSFSFGEKFPLTLSWNTFFAGRYDRDENDDQQYSSYVELGYDFSCGGLDFTASIGAAPWTSPAWLPSVNDRKDFQISSIALKATKNLEITPTFSVPLFTHLILSPATDAAHLVVGFSF